MKKGVLVTEEFHKLLLSKRGSIPEVLGKPLQYMLGKNKRGLVSSLSQLTNSGGCYLMHKVDASAMVRAYCDLATRGFTPCGLLRIVNLGTVVPTTAWKSYLIGGRSLFKGGVYLTFTVGKAVSILAEFYSSSDDFHRRDVPYRIVKTKKRKDFLWRKFQSYQKNF